MASTATYGPLHAALAARDPAIFDAAVNCASAARCARFNAFLRHVSRHRQAACCEPIQIFPSCLADTGPALPPLQRRHLSQTAAHHPGLHEEAAAPPQRAKTAQEDSAHAGISVRMAASCMHDRHLLMMVLLTCVSRVGTPCLASHRGLQIPNDAASKSTCDSRHCACRSAHRLTTPWHMARTRCRKSASGAHASHRMQRPLPLTPRTKQVGKLSLIIPPTCLV